MKLMENRIKKYMLSKSEVLALKEISKGELPYYELRKKMTLSPASITIRAHKLQRKKFVFTKRRGMKKYIQITDSKHATLMRDLLLTYTHIPWEKVLSNHSLYILLKILNNQKLRNIIPKATLWRHLRNLRMHGIVLKTNDKYVINPRHGKLIDFLREYQSFITNEAVQSVSSDAVILWQDYLECLLKIPKKVKIIKECFFETALSYFPEFEIPLIMNDSYYFFSMEKRFLQKEDVILHTLLIEKNNIRYTLYSLLLMKKIQKELNEKYLLHEAKKFQLDKQVAGMLRFLETDGKVKDVILPTWQEFLDKSKEYGVR